MDTIRQTWTYRLLHSLRSLLPCDDEHRHSLAIRQYGSDEQGWENKLAIQVWFEGKPFILFPEESDLEKEPECLALECVKLLQGNKEKPA